MFAAGEHIKIFFDTLHIFEVKIDACGRTGPVDQPRCEEHFAFDTAGKEDVVVITGGFDHFGLCGAGVVEYIRSAEDMPIAALTYATLCGHCPC